MSHHPIAGISNADNSDSSTATLEARSNEPGAFTGYFDEGVAKAIGNGEMTIGQWTAHAIEVSGKDLRSADLGELASEPGFIAAASQHAITMRPQNAHLRGRTAESRLEAGESYHTSFGRAVQELAELYKKNPSTFDEILSAAPNATSAATSEAQRGHLHATGQVPSIGLPLPTRAPGDT